RLDSLIQKKASATDVSSLASLTENKVIAASGLQIVPSKSPSLENGKIIFKTECAKCHGSLGYGDGPEGKGLDPAPRNFMDDERMRTISPFTSFNTIRLGVEGTGMKAHPGLEDEEVWDVAFYITSLRYQKNRNHPFLKEGATQKIIDSISTGKIAVSSDEEFLKSFQVVDTDKAKLLLTAIRLKPAAAAGSEFINTSLKYLDGAMTLYRQGKYFEASQLATLAYLEGIEPIEKQLRASDPQLMLRLEEQMLHLRRMMEENHSALEVNDSLIAVRKTITHVSELLHNEADSFWLALLLAASVLLREGLEAFLVIMVILSVLKATELKQSVRWVHAGWMVAVLVGILMWLLGERILAGQRQHVELIEGVVSFVAVAMLLYVGFWLHSKSEIGRWKDYVSKMMKGVVSRQSVFGLAALSFFVVFREVFESVLFLSALNIESGGKQSDAIVLGVVIAFVVVIVLAFLLMRFTTKLPIPKLFKFSSFVMGALAVILAGKGVHSFQETGLIPIHGIPVPRIELLGIFPTLESCAAQVFVLLVVIVTWQLTVSGKKK
ncbi:MAG: FTR1 family protein, partial [Bacteroidota bacterium]